MMQVPAKRSWIFQALCVLCMALVCAMGTVQAVHSHPVNSQTSHHSCSICSAPSLGPATATVSVLPMVKPVAMAHFARETFVVFRPVVTNFVRPPPAV
jgi:Fe-S-cluster-containing hydrogenase component 2